MISPELKRNTQEMYQAESTDELSKKRHLIHYHSEKKSKEVISPILFNINSVARPDF